MEKHIVKEGNVRIDVYLSKLLDVSRSKIGKLDLKVNDKNVKSSYIVKENDVIDIPVLTEEEIKAEPEKLNLDIVYEDDDVIVVNKPNGMVVHPAFGNTKHTLVNGLLYHSKELSKNNGEFRPGIVHRIDAYTTGLLMIAKNDKAHEFLAKQLSEKTTHRKYIALVWGVINNDTGTIDAPIGRDINDRKKMSITADGKEAITHFKVLERYKTATLIELKLETGRTHQIRVHMNYINHPVVNDPVYGKRKLIDNTGQCLHAKELGFIHPKTKKYMEFNVELPECFINILNKFKEEIC
ncbi:MAG TPA: RluA family pseudouridine synthase [Candidatus Faecisoma merdavium]|nr:RluA family pseudouridine synthase [Candidatus Faecisoma merdavium]